MKTYHPLSVDLTPQFDEEAEEEASSSLKGKYRCTYTHTHTESVIFLYNTASGPSYSDRLKSQRNSSD